MKTKPSRLHGPLKSWDMYAMHLTEQAVNFSREEDLATLKVYKRKFNWCLDLDSLLRNNKFEALILTNPFREIQWVNNGFTKMTGYTFKYAKGKTPVFLQGELTSPRALDNIRGYLKKEEPFKETLINYRKTGEVYNCHIEVYPLKDNNGQLTHLLALEREIRY